MLTLMHCVVNLVYPPRCAACNVKRPSENAHNFVCAGCWAAIQRTVPPFCPSCGRHTAPGGRCGLCIRQAPRFDRAFSPCLYTGVLKDIIHAFKYKGKNYLGRPLGSLMTSFIDEYNLPLHDIDFILPVPLHPARLREREFNQSEILGAGISKRLGKKMNTAVLKRTRQTRTQTELPPEQRLKNVAGSFSITEAGAVCDTRILLIDDVLTTGATASEAAATLKDAGAASVWLFTLAS